MNRDTPGENSLSSKISTGDPEHPVPTDGEIVETLRIINTLGGINAVLSCREYALKNKTKSKIEVPIGNLMGGTVKMVINFNYTEEAPID